MKRIRPFLYLTITALLSACSFSLAADVTPPPGYQPPPVETQPVPVSAPLYPLAPPDPAAGEPIFAEKCAPCHGQTGLGDGPRAAQLPNPVSPLGSADLARKSTPAEWFRIVTQGNLERFMPPFASLTDGERWDVVAYAFSLSRSPDALEQGKQLYQANCAGCHGEAGKGDGSQAAGLSVKPQDFSSLEFMAGKSAADLYQSVSEGVPPEMPGYAAQLSADQIWLLADYLRSMAFNPAQPAQQAVAAPGSQAAGTPLPPQAGLGVTTSVTSGMTSTLTTTVGEITGMVVDGSGGQVPAGTQVMLHGFDQMQTLITSTTTTQADGSFAFEDVEMPVGRAFLATTQYEGTTYSSDIATAEQGKNILSLPITVFATTTDTSVLSVDRLHLFFEFVDQQTVRVIELYIISNSGNKTVIASQPDLPTLTFQLPQSATNLEFQDGELGGRYLQVPGGFGDTVPVQPGSGSYQVLFAFEMPYDRSLKLAQPMPLPVNAVVILAPEGNLKIKGDNLQDAGVRSVQDTNYHMYNGSALAAGEELSLTVTGSPASGAATLSTGSSTNLLVGLGAFGVVLIAAGVWLFMRNRASQAVEDAEREPVASGAGQSENAETVMDAILALDDLYTAGELPEEAYRKRRAELKARLKELLD